jgi:hypothetical protein
LYQVEVAMKRTSAAGGDQAGTADCRWPADGPLLVLGPID